MSLSRTISLALIACGRKIVKNTALEKSAIVLAIYKSVFRLGFKPTAGDQSFKLRGETFVISGQDTSMLPGLLNQTYEKHELDFYLSRVREGDIIFDVGANVGLYARLGAKKVGPTGRVHAFEPSPLTLKFLKMNCADLSNLTIVEKAISDHPGETTLYVETSDLGCSSLLAKTQEGVRVTVTTVDEYLSTLPLQRVDFIKMDIEGFEQEALRGMKRALQLKPTVLMEFNPSFLRQHGRDPEAFLKEIHSVFPSVRYIHESTGELLPLKECADLGHQIIANLVLETTGEKPASK